MTDEELKGVVAWLRGSANEEAKLRLHEIQNAVEDRGKVLPQVEAPGGLVVRADEVEGDVVSGVRRSLEELRAQVASLTGSVTLPAAQQGELAAQGEEAANTRLLASSLAPSTSSVLGTIGRSFILSPILGGLMRLFGRKEEETPPALVKYVAPAPFGWEEGVGAATGWRAAAIDRGASGEPRIAAAGRGSIPEIHVNVQAIDSRSFLDHRDAIASAVREALLQSHDLKDVLQEI
jgi:hypothetical protein